MADRPEMGHGVVVPGQCVAKRAVRHRGLAGCDARGSGESLRGSKIDGAGEIRRFVFITVPLIRGALSFVVVISIIHAFQAFDLVYVLTGRNGGPETGTYVLGIMLFQNAFAFLEFGYASALAWVMFAILLVLTVLQLRLARQALGRPIVGLVER